jgi:hypothetical protein
VCPHGRQRAQDDCPGCGKRAAELAGLLIGGASPETARAFGGLLAHGGYFTALAAAGLAGEAGQEPGTAGFVVGELLLAWLSFTTLAAAALFGQAPARPGTDGYLEGLDRASLVLADFEEQLRAQLAAPGEDR